MSQFVLDYSVIIIASLVFIIHCALLFERHAGKVKLSDEDILRRWVKLQQIYKRRNK